MITVYSFVFLVISFCTLFSYGQHNSKINNVLFWSCAIILIILTSIRDFTVGADTLNYCEGFLYLRQLPLSIALRFGWERGYVFINWLLGHFFNDARALLVFMAIFILIPIFKWIKRESQYPLLSLVIFVSMGMWNSSMFILRQWCAMAILTYSYKYIKERNFLKFIFIVLIAMMFHRTAAIFILAYFIEDISISKTKIFLSIPLSIVIGLLGGKILSILNQFARISESGNFNGGISILIVLWFCVIARFICFKGELSNQLNFYFKLVFLAAFLQPIAFSFSNWARVITYFSISLTIYLPNLLGKLTDKNTSNYKLRVPIVCIFMVLMFVWFNILDLDIYYFMK